MLSLIIYSINEVLKQKKNFANRSRDIFSLIEFRRARHKTLFSALAISEILIYFIVLFVDN